MSVVAGLLIKARLQNTCDAHGIVSPPWWKIWISCQLAEKRNISYQTLPHDCSTTETFIFNMKYK